MFQFGLKRLIGTMQVSSCAVERVFPQLKLIRDQCGDNLYEDILEVRMFARCNGSDVIDDLWGRAFSIN